MKIKNALLLIVISLFFGIGNVFASEIHFWDLSSSSHNHTDYRLALLTGTNEYNTISVTLSTYGYNPTVFTINSSDLNTTSFSFGQPIENSSLNVTEYKHHLYFYNNGKLSGSIDDLGTLTMSNSNEYDMSTFPGRVEEINIKLRVCEKDPNPMLDGVYYDVNGNIVSEAEYISSCKSSDSGSTDGDDIGNTGDTGGGASNDSSSSDGKNESNSESNFSSSSESKSDSASKDGDIENPDTGIGFQYGLLLVLIVSGVLIGYYIKKHNKIHKI